MREEFVFSVGFDELFERSSLAQSAPVHSAFLMRAKSEGPFELLQADKDVLLNEVWPYVRWECEKTWDSFLHLMESAFPDENMEEAAYSTWKRAREIARAALGDKPCYIAHIPRRSSNELISAITEMM